MSLIVDQTWVAAWVSRKVDPAEVGRYMANLNLFLSATDPAHLRDLPPLCLVAGERNATVPYPGTLGIVTGYSLDGSHVQVRQSPREEPVWVPRETIRLAYFWHGIGSSTVQAEVEKMPTA